MTVGGENGSTGACDACLRRTALLARLAPHIERARHERRRLAELLALDDERLLVAVAGRDQPAVARAYERFRAAQARERLQHAQLHALCRHAEGYPERLLDADDPPAVLHVAGDPARLVAIAPRAVPVVAIVGARRAGAGGLEVARGLGRGLAAAGVTVVSGMALGIDSAAHAGALEVDGPTLTVLAGGADVPYPSSKRRLYAALVAGQCAVSEMPPGFTAFRWCFPARNRTIAGLADLTIVVEAAERSGSLITAELAQQLGRTVGAVPGPVDVPRSAGANGLLRDGAVVIRHAQDALDEALGIGVATVMTGRGTADLDAQLRELLASVQDGRDCVEALASTPAEARTAMAGLVELELLGLLRRAPGGRYVRVR